VSGPALLERPASRTVAWPASTESDRLAGELLYSQCWEDLACGRAALQIRPGQRVLAIGAAGDNALGLLLDDPGWLLAVDVNPAQTALLELKRAAVGRLAPGEVGPFLGNGRSGARLATYARLRSALPAAARDYWDDQAGGLQAGVIHIGRFERYLALFRRLVLPLAPGQAAVRALLAAQSCLQQRKIYARCWDSPAWRGLFRLFFSRRLLAALGRHPALFAHCQTADLGRHYLERARFGLTEIPIASNSYLCYMLSGGYDSPARTPDYLRPTVQPHLRTQLGRLEVQALDLQQALAALPSDSIDAFYLSDVFELFSHPAYEATLIEIARVGRPGARLCYWNNLVDRRRPAELSGLLASHQSLADKLARRDRAFLYSRFVVESVRGAVA
jgi:S-adenosylmethionine-diacylglycerol 3-amino-3-carboxypropyl transferase